MSILYNIKKNKNKKLIFLLQNIYGINKYYSKLICTSLGYDKNIKLFDISDNDLKKIDNIINVKYKIKISMELNNFNYENIVNLKNINSYRGVRHQYHLPVRGQNTKNNAKTVKLSWIKKN